MEKKEYLIGDVAEMMGISRDTLRFYEKRGIISVKKRANGYRYFSDEDIVKLCSVMYSRKMDIGLEEIENIWKEDGSYRTIGRISERKIAEEEEEIRRHRQILTRLRMTQEDCRKIEENLDKISLMPFPKAYLIKKCNTQQESISEWFRLSQEHPGLDMIYTYDIFQFEEAGKERAANKSPDSDTIKMVSRGTYLLLYQGLEKELDLNLDMKQYPVTKQVECVHTILETPGYFPDSNEVQKMAAWARENNRVPAGRIYSVRMTQGAKEGENVHYLELLMPLKEAE